PGLVEDVDDRAPTPAAHREVAGDPQPARLVVRPLREVPGRLPQVVLADEVRLRGQELAEADQLFGVDRRSCELRSRRGAHHRVAPFRVARLSSCPRLKCSQVGSVRNRVSRPARTGTSRGMTRTPGDPEPRPPTDESVDDPRLDDPRRDDPRLDDPALDAPWKDLGPRGDLDDDEVAERAARPDAHSGS